MFYQWPRLLSDWFSQRAVPKALVLSLACHLALFLFMDAVVGVTPLFRSANRTTLAQLKEEARARAQAAEEAEREAPPLVFVEVDPTQASEPPKETQFYSTANSQAGNPTVGNDTVPKIDGKEDTVPKTFDTTRPAEAFPLQPTVATPQEQPIPESQPRVETTPQVAKAEPIERQERPEPQPEQKPIDIEPVKDALVLAPEPAIPQVEPPSSAAPARPAVPPRQRPRRLAEVVQDRGRLIGEKMRMDGGVRRFQLEPGLDVKESPFGDYDAAFIAAVQNRWYQLLDERNYVGSYRGKVVLEFRLQPDGRVTHMRVGQNEVSDTLSWLCQRAVEDPAPYGKFPSDLRRLLKTDYREVRFTFHYR